MTTLYDVQSGVTAALQSAIDHLGDLQEENDLIGFVADYVLADIVVAIEAVLQRVSELPITQDPVYRTDPEEV